MSGTEADLGLEVFLSSTPGVGGVIKIQPEDFVVEEVSETPPLEEGGPFTAWMLRSRDWETNRLVRAISRQLGISRRRVKFAGTKDKRAVSTRLFVIEAPQASTQGFSLQGVEILQSYPTAKTIEIGDLRANRFEIVLRRLAVSEEQAAERVEGIAADLATTGGFPNFFGVQRFGVGRPITHRVGKAILRGQFREAVRLYVGTPLPGESGPSFQARSHYDETEDPRETLRLFPDSQSFEKAILNHLVQHPGDFVGALLSLPKNLQMMFIHAYQGYLFNRALSRRVKEGLPLNRPVVGDFVLPVGFDGIPISRRLIPVESHNLEKIAAQVREGRAAVSGMLPGSQIPTALGRMGEIERAVLENEGVQARDFLVPDAPRLSSKGLRRPLLVAPRNFEATVEGGALRFRFELPPGAYATSLLREYMKADLEAYAPHKLDNP